METEADEMRTRIEEYEKIKQTLKEQMEEARQEVARQKLVNQDTIQHINRVGQLEGVVSFKDIELRS